MLSHQCRFPDRCICLSPCRSWDQNVPVRQLSRRVALSVSRRLQLPQRGHLQMPRLPKVRHQYPHRNFNRTIFGQGALISRRARARKGPLIPVCPGLGAATELVESLLEIQIDHGQRPAGSHPSFLHERLRSQDHVVRIGVLGTTRSKTAARIGWLCECCPGL